MVAPAFPLAKLGFLVIKQVSKPLANAVAKRAKNSKFFRNYVVLPVAQFFHWADVKVRMRILNLGKVTKVPKVRTYLASLFYFKSTYLFLNSYILIYHLSCMLRSCKSRQVRKCP